mmetsp:Transcript_35876/g.85983  ORF Transcript_35876/g.85983 Transcript_35876/m.85983 type:complete len:243 (+) Transcript_35876:1495-2223(+)
MLMLMIKSVRPAAALDLRFMTSTLNSSCARMSWMFLKAVLGTRPSSIFCLKPSIISRKAGGGDIIFCAAFHEVSTFLKGMSFCWIMQRHAPVTRSTPAGGCLSDFSSPRSLTLSDSSAAEAAISAGSAAASLFSISALSAMTSTSTLEAASAILLALAASMPALPFSSSSLGIMASTSIFLASTSTVFTLISSSSSPTPSAVVSSLITPSESLVILSLTIFRRCASIWRKSAMSSRKDLGVV